MKSILIFGRQPELGLAEIESLYGSDSITPLEGCSAVVDVDPCNLQFNRLGGSIKLGKLLTEIEDSAWSSAEKLLIKEAPEHAKKAPEGKMTIGLSAYNFNITP